MAEVFKPRANMTYENNHRRHSCYDENGKLVCDGGPSVIWDDGGYWEFYITDIGRHRFDGPATSYGEWFIYRKNVTLEIKAFAKENDIDLNNLSDEDKILIALKFS